MMYSQKMSVSIKVNGKVLREHGEIVALPFGSEYSISFKNLNSVRALVSAQVDGQEATENIKLIVPANGTLDLERFIKNGNMTGGNRFKFIERSTKIEEHRGIGAEDGLIRVEYQFERKPVKVCNPVYTPLDTGYFKEWSKSNVFRTYGSTPTGYVGKYGSYDANVSSTYSDTTPISSVKLGSSQSLNNTGITVPGSASEQQFIPGHFGQTDGQTHVMVINLKGKIADEEVQEPVFVKTKPVCKTCGTSNKVGSKFCKECGTALTII